MPPPHAASAPAPRRDRPPLRRSIRLDEEDAAADERRRAFGRRPRAPSIDEDDASDARDACECGRSPSSPRADTPSADEDDLEPELVSPPEPAATRRAASAERAPPPPRALSQGVFERRLPRLYRFGLGERCKRASSSALYERAEERSPTEAFYNATGSTRLSSQELFEKFCSEDFTSLYGRCERRHRPPHSKSTGSSGPDVRAACCRRAPAGSQPALCRRRAPHTAPQSDRSTDDDDASPQAPRPEDDCSRSAPPLSPDRFEARFTFDISERSEVASVRDETPSDATETRNLTLYEEPHSDRTSVCELYDAAFASNRPSLRRDGSRRRAAGTVDLSALDFRAIDDESPRASRRSLDDTLRQNSESRSWASDSVFATPRRAPAASPCSGAPSTAASTALESTLAEDEAPSVIERREYALALQLGRIELDDERGTPGGGSARLSSRPSMHKLEPLEPEPESASSGGRTSSEASAGSMRRRRGTSEPPRRSTRCFPL